MATLRALSNGIVGNFTSPAGYFFWGWLLCYAVVSLAIGWRESGSWREALRFAFPRRTFRGPSARLDYKLFLFGQGLIVYPLVAYLFLGQDTISTQLAAWVSTALAKLGLGPLPISNGRWVDALYTLSLIFVADLGWNLQHQLFHRVPRLWAFHRVHHSATELNVFTIARLHPVDALTQGWAAGLFLGVWIGLIRVTLGTPPSLVTFLHASAAMALFRVLGIFRHSHVWIGFGPVLSRVLCSPAMHQIHHSQKREHYDRNFSVVFSFWDWVFGTLYVPTEKEALQFGIQGEEPLGDSFWAALRLPFRREMR